jgi:superfamily II DNA/RNA helicase
MSKKSASGAPKKARWTPLEKKAARTSAKISAEARNKKPRTGPPRSSRPATSGAPHAGGREWRPAGAEQPRRDHGSNERRGYDRRDDRGERRPFERRDDRGERRPFERRDERPSFERRDERPSFDRRPTGRTDDRPRYDRRDDRGERRPFERRDERPSQDRRDERPSFDRRDDRRPFERRDDRQRGFDRPRQDRDDRRPFTRREDRPGTDRPGTDRQRSFDRPRQDRGGDRRPFERRDDRPSYDRPGNDRPSYDRPRQDRGDDRRPFERRDDRPRSFERRDDRGDRRSFDRRDDRGDRRSFDRRDDRPSFDRRGDRPSSGGHSSYRDRDTDRSGASSFDEAEAERIDADTWTKATRTPVTDGPVEVAEDNGFTALGLPERVVERLARDGITAPFPIQVATIPDALAGRDVLGRGQTGSGKTLAFGLPTITRLLEAGLHRAPRRPRALVLVPTRELAMQVSDALEPLVHVAGLRHKLIAGGLSYTTQINALNKGVDLLIATPGRLNDLIERGAVELGDVSIAIVDEADHMAEMGFLPEITSILDLVPAGGQRLLFSATLDHGIDGLVERYLTDPAIHSTSDATASVETMDHHVLLIDPMHKKALTADVANGKGRTIVFCRTKLGADRVARQLREEGVMAAALHGGLNQGARNRVLGAFREGTLPVLVATDVAARGIHVDDVSVVLQADPPADHKDYLHRSGRTARAGEQGTVITLVLPHQRRTMERQLAEAGVDTALVKTAPGDDNITATGATRPSGVPIPDEDFARLLEGPRQRRAPAGSRGPRGGRQAQPSRGRPQHGGRDDRRDRRGDRDEPLVDRWGGGDRRSSARS